MATQSTHFSRYRASHGNSLLDRQKIYEREPADLMEDLDVNAAIWGMFLNTTLQAAVHLGQDDEVNLRFVKNHLWKSWEQLLNETRRLIRAQTEVIGIKTIDFKELTWRSTSLLCSRAYQITNAQTYIFSDSVPFVGKMGDDPIATWKSKIKWYSENNHVKDVNRIDGKPTEFEWKRFPGFTTLDLLKEIQSLMRNLQCEPEHFNDKIIFMSMYNDIARQEKGNKERCEYNNEQTIANSARKFHLGHWSLFGPGSEEKWYGTYTEKPDGSWDQTAGNTMKNFSESGHPIFRASNA